MIVTQQAEGGKMALQLFPCFFREFLVDPNEGITVAYKKHNISICEDVTFNVQLTSQYENMFKPVTSLPIVTPTTPVAGPDANNNVIKLFDD